MNNFCLDNLSLKLYDCLFLFPFWNSLELNFAVNVAATYTLTELVMPLLEKAAPDARVITVASGGMYTEPLNKDLQVLYFLCAFIYII
jgi:NAD(P)-dependent dehydrogenase (short-subunit alcohol dehydrogenase family)